MMKRSIGIVFFIMLLAATMQAQVVFEAVLLNSIDKKPVPFAAIKLTDTGQSQTSDSLGHFSFVLVKNLDTLHFEIASLGYHASIVHYRTHTGVEKVYIDKKALAIGQVEIKGLSARKVVEKAIAEIPNLYASTSYVANSFFRQIHKENGQFVRFIELQASTMFQLAVEKKKLKCTEAMAIVNMRRAYDYEKNRLPHLDHFFDLLIENPVYHLRGSVLNPSATDMYKFRFDTVATTPDVYVINYESEDYSGEFIQSGKLTIDKATFAIIKIAYTNAKNKFGNHVVVLSSEYISDYIGGTFSAEYMQVDGKWYLKQLLREYTSQIYFKPTMNKSSYITETFEWYCDSVSNRVQAALIDQYYSVSNLYSGKYTYNKNAWLTETHPFVYFTRDEVYKSMSHTVPIEEQFEKAGE